MNLVSCLCCKKRLPVEIYASPAPRVIALMCEQCGSSHIITVWHECDGLHVEVKADQLGSVGSQRICVPQIGTLVS